MPLEGAKKGMEVPLTRRDKEDVDTQYMMSF